MSLLNIIKEEIRNLLKEIESPLDPNYMISNIPPGYDGNILNEESEEAIIEITPVIPDERSGKQQLKVYNVNYQKNIGDELIEIEGTLVPHHTGRNIEYGFEPAYFDEQANQDYWNENWETIEDEIRNKFYFLRY